jgi:hypothetical protein
MILIAVIKALVTLAVSEAIRHLGQVIGTAKIKKSEDMEGVGSD